jgi:hypothetical protein
MVINNNKLSLTTATTGQVLDLTRFQIEHRLLMGCSSRMALEDVDTHAHHYSRPLADPELMAHWVWLSLLTRTADLSGELLAGHALALVFVVGVVLLHVLCWCCGAELKPCRQWSPTSGSQFYNLLGNMNSWYRAYIRY